MNILIYSPDNARAADQQAQAELLLSLGHKVFLLTWAPEGILHQHFLKLGAKVYSSVYAKGRSIFFFIRQSKYLSEFCKQHQIDVVISILQSNAVVAGMAKHLCKARFIYMRHNAEYIALRGSKKEKIINWLANKLSPEIIAISNNVKTELLKEGVNEKKITRINLCYNFAHYEAERKYNHKEIREQLNTPLLIICVARLDPLKHHIKAFEIVEQLVQQNISCKLLCIGDGPFKAPLEQWIKQHGLEEYIILRGFITNVFDYLIASDIMLLLSESEASNNAVKEMAICNKTAIVCKSTGDFEEYFQNGVNGFLVDKAAPQKECVAILVHLYKNYSRLDKLGRALHTTVSNRFDMRAVREKYIALLSN
jgi:glycosyltransferase involved in cell wall biosynthesis